MMVRSMYQHNEMMHDMCLPESSLIYVHMQSDYIALTIYFLHIYMCNHLPLTCIMSLASTYINILIHIPLEIGQHP